MEEVVGKVDCQASFPYSCIAWFSAGMVGAALFLFWKVG